MNYIERIQECQTLKDLYELRDAIASEILQMRSAAMAEFAQAAFYKSMIEEQIKYEAKQGNFLAELEKV